MSNNHDAETLTHWLKVRAEFWEMPREDAERERRFARERQSSATAKIMESEDDISSLKRLIENPIAPGENLTEELKKMLVEARQRSALQGELYAEALADFYQYDYALFFDKNNPIGSIFAPLDASNRATD